MTSIPFSTFSIPSQPLSEHTSHLPSWPKLDNMKGFMRGELGSQTWQIPPNDFVRMLSPKTPLGTDGSLLYLEDFHCESDEKWFREACDYASALYLKDYPGPGSSDWRGPIKQEPLNYVQFRSLLNYTVAVCRKALNKYRIKTTPTLLEDLHFTLTDGCEAKDCTRGAERRFKPDIIAEDLAGLSEAEMDQRTKDRPWWSAPDEQSRQITFPVEVKSSWSIMIAELATYARSQFDAYPSRTFSFAIAFHYIKLKARFVIFHRSGLTASNELDLTEDSDRIYFLDIMMTIMTWKDPHDAGFPECNDNRTYYLQDGSKENAWKICKRLHQTTRVRGRATHVNKLQLQITGSRRGDAPTSPCLNYSEMKRMDGTKQPGQATRTNPVENKDTEEKNTECKVIVPSLFAVPSRVRAILSSRLIYTATQTPLANKRTMILKDCWPAVERAEIESKAFGNLQNAFGVCTILATQKVRCLDGQPQATTIYLPKKDVAESFHWSMADAECKPPEGRIRTWICMESEGESLMDCESGDELLLKVAHSILGWLNLYQNGYLHRDISVNNILGFKKGGEMRIPFRVLDKWRTASDKDALDILLRKLGDPNRTRYMLPDVSYWAERLQSMVENYKIGSLCYAFILDGDMAKDHDYLFEHWDELQDESKRERSGTIFFMSKMLLSDTLSAYVQSPIDDLESFFHVVVWAALNNNKTTYMSKWETKWKDCIRGEVNHRDIFEDDIGDIEMNLSPIMMDIRRALLKWIEVKNDIRKRWKGITAVYDDICADKANWSKDDEIRFWKAAWHGFAFEGVCRIVEAIYENLKLPPTTEQN